jgi:hypothetical protein
MNIYEVVVNLLAPFLAGAAGVGATFGVFRTTLLNLKERVIRLEGIIDHQVRDARCDSMRAACQRVFRDDFDDIKGELREQRKNQEEVLKFMGRMSGVK